MKRVDVSAVWARRANLNRSDLFGSTDDKLRPISAPEHIDVCIPGMVGTSYTAGGLAIVSVNPAGGRDNFLFSESDNRLYNAAKKFSGTGSINDFENLNEVFANEMPTWGPQWRVVNSILCASGKALNQIAYPYLVPFRSRGDAGSALPKSVLDAGYMNFFIEMMVKLRPGYVVVVDRPSQRAIERLHHELQLDFKTVYFTRKRDAHRERSQTLRTIEHMMGTEKVDPI